MLYVRSQAEVADLAERAARLKALADSARTSPADVARMVRGYRAGAELE